MIKIKGMLLVLCAFYKVDCAKNVVFVQLGLLLAGIAISLRPSSSVRDTNCPGLLRNRLSAWQNKMTRVTNG